jgi:dipeptidase D
MEDQTLAHPPMEFLFTVDEETGLTGANQLTDNFVDGRILLNIDSEEEGALYIGCAGGKHTILRTKIDWVERHSDHKTFALKVEGLRGGHSGLSIHEGFGNAVKLLGRLLYNLKGEFHFHLARIEGGNKHNAIPREAEAVIDVPAAAVDQLKKLVAGFEAICKDELKFTDKEVRVKLEEAPAPQKVFSSALRDRLLGVLYAVPHGVVEMSRAIPGLVETSTNMAIIKTEKDVVELLTSQRSSVASAIIDIADKVKALGELGGFEVEQGGGYPAWQPNPSSKLLATCKEIFKNKYGKEPAVKAIHAGLECGIIGDHYSGMDMISLGPDLVAVHSPDEKINIQSVANVWDFLLDILKNIK